MAGKFLTILEKIGVDVIKWVPGLELIENEAATFIPGAAAFNTPIDAVANVVVSNVKAAQAAQAANPAMTSAQQATMAVSLSTQAAVQAFAASGNTLSTDEQTKLQGYVTSLNNIIVAIGNLKTTTTPAAA